MRKQLSKERWKAIKEGGAGIDIERFYDDKDSARAIALSLLIKPVIVLQIQEEISSQERPLGDTTVARTMGLWGKVDRETRINLQNLNRLQESTKASKTTLDTRSEALMEEQERKLWHSLSQHGKDKEFLNTNLGRSLGSAVKHVKRNMGSRHSWGEYF